MSNGKMRRPQLIDALNHAMRDVSALGVLYSQAVAERLGVNSTDLECLDFIIRGPVTAGRLAEATGLTTGAITGVIDRLERLGFAQRERHGEDRRKVLVRALPAVERIVPLFQPMERAAMGALAAYSDKELAFLLAFLTRMRDQATVAMTQLRERSKPEAENRAENRTKNRTKKPIKDRGTAS